MKKFLYYNTLKKKWRKINNNYHYCITIYKKNSKNLYNYDESACVHLTGSHGNDKQWKENEKCETNTHSSAPHPQFSSATVGHPRVLRNGTLWKYDFQAMKRRMMQSFVFDC